MSVSSQLMAAVFSLISGLDSSRGMPIAILDRIDDTQMFWARTAAILCQKTGDNFCEEHVRFMVANTEPMGMSRVLEYTTNGVTKRVCAVLPPIDAVDATSLGESFGTGMPTPDQTPNSEMTQAWITLYHAAHCLDTNGAPEEEKRAATFATIGLTIVAGDPTFTGGMRRSPARQLGVISGQESAYWGAGVGERLLLNLWKQEAANKLRYNYSCNASVIENTSIDVENIKRDAALKPEESCTPGVTMNGVVSDANVWIWMYGTGGLGVPPEAWLPMKMFSSATNAAGYAIETAESLARQK